MPEPSRLIAFEQLPSMAQGTKVRFLAWYDLLLSTLSLERIHLTRSSVHSYDPKTAKLMLEDRSAATSSITWASVNIENILENISHELLEVGAWINVVGTIRGGKSRSSKKVPCPAIDATMIWSAGAIKLEEYRSAVEAYRDALSPANPS